MKGMIIIGKFGAQGTRTPLPNPTPPELGSMLS